MNFWVFSCIAALTLLGAFAAATLPKLIHAALALVVAFVGVAAFYFFLGAEFVGLAQIFVYVGAVAVLIVFTILLTRREHENVVGCHWVGAVIAVAVFAGLVLAITRTPGLDLVASAQAEPLTVKRIGEVLLRDYVWPLLGLGVLLTAALIGALLLVMEEKR